MSNDFKIFDWKGNEIKEGMTIYFVQTSAMNFGRFGMFIPDGVGGGHSIYESDEDYEKRKEKQNEPIWHLGMPYNVEEKNGDLFYTTPKDEDDYTLSFQLRYRKDSTIAIKGISDTKKLNQ